MRNFIYFIILLFLFCNNAKAETKTQIIAKIQKIDAQKLANSNKIHILIEQNLGKSIIIAQKQLAYDQAKIIPSLQKSIDIIQKQATEYQTLQPKYEKLKWSCCLISFVLVFILTNKFLSIVPPPVKYYIAAGIAGITFTIMSFKI